MNVLSFDEFEQQPMPLTFVLSTLQNANVLSDDVRKLIECSYSLDGYITGGFASVLFRGLGYHSNACNGTSVRQAWFHLAQQYFSAGADIDLFFRDPQQIEQLRGVFKFDFIKTENSWMVKTKKTTIQFITKHAGTPNRVMQTFDISNACCALVDDKLIYPAGFVDLIMSRRIHVNQWTPMSVKRVQKWFKRQAPWYVALHRDNNKKYLEEKGMLYMHTSGDGYV